MSSNSPQNHSQGKAEKETGIHPAFLSAQSNVADVSSVQDRLIQRTMGVADPYEPHARQLKDQIDKLGEKVPSGASIGRKK